MSLLKGAFKFMAIPDFQTIMLPLLKFCADSFEHTRKDTIDYLAREFTITDEERRQLLPSGSQNIFDNRVAWARSYLKMAGLIINTKRGVFKITDRGRQVLSQNPNRIDIKFLRQFPDFEEMRHGRQKSTANKEISINEDQPTATPQEQLEDAYEILRRSLSQDILTRLKTSSPRFFEKAVVEVLVKMGYGGSRKDAGQAIGCSGDEGIDGIIKEDRLGLDIIYIQAKRWENTVSRPEIQKFAGALQGKRARKGIFITTSDFSKSALEYASAIDSKIILIDGQQLAQYMMDFNVGAATEITYEVKRLDLDYFDELAE
jgi:restriction system protein